MRIVRHVRWDDGPAGESGGFQRRKRRMIARPQCMSGLGDIMHTFELSQQHRGDDFARRKRRAQILPRVEVSFTAIEGSAIRSMTAGDLGAVGETCVIHDQRAGLAGNYVLGIVKTETRSVRAYRLAFRDR